MVDALSLRPQTGLIVLSLLLLVLASVLYWGLFLPEPDSYDRTTLTVGDGTGTQLTTVDARIADSMYKQYIGLSRTDSLSGGEGMIFTHSNEETRRYAMRGMDVSIDIVFIDSDGQITSIHSAERPTTLREYIFYDTYRGTGKWVLEVPYGWAEQHGVSEGDTVRNLPT